MPIKFRDKLTSGAIITRGLDYCLFVFSVKEWETLAQKLVALPLAQANSRAFVRLMLAGAMDVELDKQGRILIPDYLRDYANLKKKLQLPDFTIELKFGIAKRGSNTKKKQNRRRMK